MSIQTQEFSPPEIYSFPFAESQDERLGLASDKVISSLLGRFGSLYEGEMPAVVTTPTSNEYSFVVDSYARHVSEMVRENPEAAYVIYSSEKQYRIAALQQGLPPLSMDTWADFPYVEQEEYEAEFVKFKKMFVNDSDPSSIFAYQTTMRAIRREDEFLTRVAEDFILSRSTECVQDQSYAEVTKRHYSYLGSKLFQAARLFS